MEAIMLHNNKQGNAMHSNGFWNKEEVFNDMLNEFNNEMYKGISDFEKSFMARYASTSPCHAKRFLEILEHVQQRG
tara:strand:+ start:175 stop:402 length:228 start_codon:yes stop_codon:yes gene_type:complete